ncbi:MAG: glucokinase [Candidatus Woesearchaeota archaeon]
MEYEFIGLKEVKKDEYDGFVLAGDVSGTNTSLAIAGVTEKSIDPLFALRFKSQELSGITEALNETLKISAEKFGIHVSKACLSPAGPINAGRDHCKLTNTSWDIDVKKVLSDTLLESLTLINDFEAIGFGIPYLNEEDPKDMIKLTHPHNKLPKPVAKAVKGIVGAGTGLGKSILIYNTEKGNYVPSPSEGGHEDFAVVDSFEFELMNFVKNKRGGEAPVDFEDVLSGRGIVAIYEFLIDREVFKTNKISEDIDSAKDKVAIISQHAESDPACKKAFKIFIRFYARALRNTALNLMARGGMYIAGGIASKNMEFFTDGDLMKEFEVNHTQHNVLKEIPVFIIKNYNISLYGAANVAANFPELAIKKG